MTFETQHRPKPHYKDHNGFVDSAKLQIAGQSLTAQEASNKAETDVGHRGAVEKRLLAEHVLGSKGVYFPSSEEMREAIEVQDTSANVRTRQSELKERHRQELQDLYDFEAKQYFAEALNKYLSKDEFERSPPIDRLYAFSREPLQSTSTTSFATSYEAYRYSHLQTMLPLHQQHQELSTQEAQAQRQKDARFPMNIGQYRNIYNRETLLRIARFLTGDASTKEKIMDEYGWVHRQTFNLEQSYEHDANFRAEVGKKLQELESTDPRRRASLNATLTK